jgi:hypothetical protein
MEFIKWALFVLRSTLFGTVLGFGAAWFIWSVAMSFSIPEASFLVGMLVGAPVGTLAGFITGVILGARWNEKWR